MEQVAQAATNHLVVVEQEDTDHTRILRLAGRGGEGTKDPSAHGTPAPAPPGPPALTRRDSAGGQ
ncbi:hypothetical protein GCM10009661_28330 [Catellatospora chokoriensis]|uniref:Uncharacterized protein n=1 Tax=Catellatospora chokoriensis TaxID=310353 RepID=A0A8J3K752_9ACTN|nr:hypothetical protein Cch02nite_78250 [Catellatospora chokoriensis]